MLKKLVMGTAVAGAALAAVLATGTAVSAAPARPADGGEAFLCVDAGADYSAYLRVQGSQNTATVIPGTCGPAISDYAGEPFDIIALPPTGGEIDAFPAASDGLIDEFQAHGNFSNGSESFDYIDVV